MESRVGSGNKQPIRNQTRNCRRKSDSLLVPPYSAGLLGSCKSDNNRKPCVQLVCKSSDFHQECNRRLAVREEVIQDALFLWCDQARIKTQCCYQRHSLCSSFHNCTCWMSLHLSRPILHPGSCWKILNHRIQIFCALCWSLTLSKCLDYLASQDLQG